MPNQPHLPLGDSERQFLHDIGSIPPPVKTTPAGSVDSLLDELIDLMFPQLSPEARKRFREVQGE